MTFSEWTWCNRPRPKPHIDTHAGRRGVPRGHKRFLKYATWTNMLFNLQSCGVIPWNLNIKSQCQVALATCCVEWCRNVLCWVVSQRVMLSSVATCCVEWCQNGFGCVSTCYVEWCRNVLCWVVSQRVVLSNVGFPVTSLCHNFLYFHCLFETTRCDYSIQFISLNIKHRTNNVKYMKPSPCIID